MKIHIIRGQNQIGGSIIEISTNTSRVILDVGNELDEDTPLVPIAEGLFQGNAAYQAILVTHYHGDHIGLLEYILPGIPAYLGEKAYAVYRASREYLGKTVINPAGFLYAGCSFNIGDIQVTPFLCDHSAFDSYMLLLECDGKRLLYTGDFRANGRKSFPMLLKRLPTVDILITEGTTLSRHYALTLTEHDLEERAVHIISQTETPVLALMAATNIDRLVTMYRAAKRSKRLFLEDTYTSLVAIAAGENIPNPITFSDVRVFLTIPNEKQYAILQKFGKAKIGRSEIAKRRFVMCVRPSMRSYLDRLATEMSFDGGYLFYSMWDGYRNKPDIEAFLSFAEDKGLHIKTLHTSGHADRAAFDALIRTVRPQYILPVHTENATWFERYKISKIIYENTFKI